MNNNESRFAEFDTLCDLIDARQYEKMIDLIRENLRPDDVSNRRPLAVLLAAIVEVLHGALECQGTVIWHQQIIEDAITREARLQELARYMLDYIELGGLVGQSIQTRPGSRQTLLGKSQPPRVSQGGKGFDVLRMWLSRLFESGQRTNATSLIQESQESTESRSENDVQRSAAPLDDGSAVQHIATENEEDENLLADWSRVPESQSSVIESYDAQIGTPSLVIYCFGTFRVYQHRQLVDSWISNKGVSILKYLAIRNGSPVSRDILMELLWPNAPLDSARRNLHQAVYSLRKALSHRDPNIQYILFENNRYYLNPDLELWVDTVEFERLIETGHQLEAVKGVEATIDLYNSAEALYQGDLLEDDIYEDWTRAHRERYMALYLETADRLGDYYFGKNQIKAAIDSYRKVLKRDNCHEKAHRRLMECYLTQGRRQLAIRQYETCVSVLHQELDVGPSAKTTAVYDRIKSQP